ncbi:MULTISPECIES: hypothetical protein [unclassified Streptomyces]|jgi:hypothetical protein|uniref:hypothetical protein n=1 Tax=unclassified Streptomyces TaxID=2593676 RepID=UPI0034571694
MSDEPVIKPQDMHATGTTDTEAAATATDGEVTTQDMHATSEPLTTMDMHATSEPFKPAK